MRSALRFLPSTVLMVLLTVGVATGQERTTFTGTALMYGSGFNTRMTSRTFSLTLTGRTSGNDATRFLNVLQDRGQDGLLSSIRNEELGRFSLGGQLGRPINAVIVDSVDGRQRIRAVFERWLGTAEIRGGYRSVDYPFSYIELLIDPRTGKGEGTYIAAARIRMRSGNTVEIEDFGTYPARLMGVMTRGRRSS